MVVAKPDLQLHGTITALVTPFKENGDVDYDSLKSVVEMNLAAGVNGLLPMGTTGESPTVSDEEHDAVIEFVIKLVNKRVPVIAGAGSNSTRKAVAFTEKAKEMGADAVLSVNPYYNKPNQAGLKEHFKAVAAVGVPIMLYNIPGRTNITMTPQTVKELYETIPEIVAIKEATGSLDMASEIASLCGITILSGDDSLTLPLMSVGATGVVSVLSNLAPKLVLGVTDNWRKGDVEAARKQHLQNFPIAKGMFVDPNPCPVKLALHKQGLIASPHVRLPLMRSEEKSYELVQPHLTQKEISCMIGA